MIYFDNSATTLIAPEALETYNTVATSIWGNPSSLHKMGDRAHQLLEAARKQIASLLGAKAHEIFFTSGATESNNLAIKGAALAKRQFGNHIIISSVEHASVRNAAEGLRRLGFEITTLPVDQRGFVRPEDLQAAITDQTILVSVMGVNNEIGSIQPIVELSRVLEQFPNILFHVDNVQAFGKNIWSQVYTERVDLMSFSSHKYHGPRGIGVLYKKAGKMLVPVSDGGGQEKGLRSGTENLPAIAAMAKAMRLEHEQEVASAAQESAVKQRIVDYLTGKAGITIFSPMASTFAPHILTFSLAGIRGETLVHTLESHDIFVSTTSACSSKLETEASTLAAMKVDEKIATSAIRLSFDASNTLQEADHFIKVFDEIYQHFAKVNHLGE